MSGNLDVKETDLPGLFVIDLPVFADERGWFKENYQQQKLEALGLPHFEIVQNNISFNKEIGVTRGLHAEPWEKFISVASGSIFGAWIDLRQGENFGKTFTLTMDSSKAVFVPRGVANGYQTLEENTTYTYLVNEFWYSEATYLFVNAFDPDLAINWPIEREKAILSDKDAAHPLLKDIKPMEF